MAFDLDNEELRATRKLHKINDDLYEETSDKKFKNDSVIALKFAVMQQQINEKDSRIQELEKELEKANRQLDLDYVDDNYITKEKVKEVLQNNRNELFSMTYLYKEQYRLYENQIERINKIEQELLKGGK